MSEHKPGPWMALPPAKWAGPDDEWVVPGVARCGNGELSEANARLIAAAPNMLRELQRLLRIIDSGSYRDRTELSIAAHPAIDDAREVVREALGSSP